MTSKPSYKELEEKIKRLEEDFDQHKNSENLYFIGQNWRPGRRDFHILPTLKI